MIVVSQSFFVPLQRSVEQRAGKFGVEFFLFLLCFQHEFLATHVGENSEFQLADFMLD